MPDVSSRFGSKTNCNSNPKDVDSVQSPRGAYPAQWEKHNEGNEVERSHVREQDVALDTFDGADGLLKQVLAR